MPSYYETTDKTSMQIHRPTQTMLEELADDGETYEDVVLRLIDDHNRLNEFRDLLDT